MKEEELRIKEMGYYLFLANFNDCIRNTEASGKMVGVKLKKIPLFTKKDWIKGCEKMRKKLRQVK